MIRNRIYDARHVSRPSALALPVGLATVMLICALLQGCIAAVGTGVVAAGATAYDRRTAGTLIDDEIIELKFIERVSSDKELWNQSHINVTSYNNVVLLTGEAPSETLRQRVTDVAARVPKVRSVHNELAIAAPSSLLSRSSDALVTTQAKASLANLDLDLAGRTKVVTENGVVYLMGLVTRAEGDAATNVTRQIGGVQRVVKVFEYLD